MMFANQLQLGTFRKAKGRPERLKQSHGCIYLSLTCSLVKFTEREILQGSASFFSPYTKQQKVIDKVYGFSSEVLVFEQKLALESRRVLLNQQITKAD